MFNTYFQSVMTRNDFALPSPCDLPVSDFSLVNITILDTEVDLSSARSSASNLATNSASILDLSPFPTTFGLLDLLEGDSKRF